MSPAFDDDLSLAQRVEDFAIEQFIAQACVEALDVAILPGATWCDVGGVCADRGDPLPHRLSHELWSVVGPDVARHATQDEEIGQHLDDIDGLDYRLFPRPFPIGAVRTEATPLEKGPGEANLARAS